MKKHENIRDAINIIEEQVARIKANYCRTATKKRAKGDPGLRSPTSGDVSVALAMAASGDTDHEIEAYFAGGGIRMTRNRMSRMRGANP